VIGTFIPFAGIASSSERKPQILRLRLRLRSGWHYWKHSVGSDEMCRDPHRGGPFDSVCRIKTRQTSLRMTLFAGRTFFSKV